MDKDNNVVKAGGGSWVEGIKGGDTNSVNNKKIQLYDECIIFLFKLLIHELFM